MKGMLPTRIIAWTGGVVALLSLVIGFGLRRDWVILILLPALPIYLLLMRKVSLQITITILLLVDILLSAAGSLTGGPPYFFLIGCSCALAAWESAHFLLNFPGASKVGTDTRLETIHNRDLALAIGAGFFLGVLGLNIKFNLPFGIIVVLALLIVYGLYRAFELSRKVG